MRAATVKQISECFIKPKYEVKGAKNPYYLAPTDLSMLSLHYIQKGLLFIKPSHFDGQPYSTHKLLDSLKDSLSLTFVHLYPLAGQLVTQIHQDQHECLVFVDCNKGPGARFIHATLDMSVSDILSPTDVPVVVQSFFDHDQALNHDGHSSSLLTVQVTELLDGIFLGLSMNHTLGDGTSFWLFWNIWSEIHRSKREEVLPLSRTPVLKPWFPEGYSPPIQLPFVQPNEFLSRYESPQLRERIFHFSSESMAGLKAKANEENNDNTNEISSFQALSALCWRAIVRAKRVPHDQVTSCKLSSNNRHRLDPPLPKDYFGNFINTVTTTTTAGELLKHDLGWAASLVHHTVVNHGDKSVRNFINEWLQSPIVQSLGRRLDPYGIMIASSPRFDMYGNEFGLGKAVAVRSGYANKYVGMVISYPGYEGRGSVDLEICLAPESMRGLELDEEFLGFVSSPNHINITYNYRNM